MGGLEQLVSTLGLSFASGINLYATVLVVGLAHRFEWFSFLPERLEVLSHPVVLWTAGILYALEFLADKIPVVSTVWDGFHTFIRPLGAALLALGAADEFGPAGQVVAMLIGGSIALGSHTTKAATRVLAHTAPEPATHSAISVAEDLGVVGLLALVYTYPWVALAVLIVLIVGMAIVTPMLLRTLRFVLASLFGFLFGSRSLNGEVPPETVARELESIAPGAAWRVFPAFGRSLPGVARLGRGFLAVSDGQTVFLRDGLLAPTVLKLGPPSGVDVESGLICEIVRARLESGSEGRICLTKNWSRALRAAGCGTPPSGGSGEEGLAPAAG